jgi:O-antigen/teichoic acid export membrane protein
MFFGQGISIVCQGVYFILLARLLGATQYGIYVGVVAMVTILSQYSSLGSPYVLLRYVSQNPKNFARCWGNVLVTTFFLGGLLTALLTWAGPHWAHSYTWTLVLCVAVGECFCAQIATAVGQVFQSFEKLRITALLNLLVNLLRVLLAGAMLARLHHATAWQWVVAALIVSALGAVAALMLVTRFYGKPVFSSALLRQRTEEGLIFALSGSTAGIYNDIDKAMLGHYGMNAANGIYTMAYKAVNISMVAISSVHGAAYPRFFRKGQEGVSGTTAYAKKILKRTVPIGLLLAGVMFLTAPIIPHLVGIGFSESVVALRWLCLLPFFRAFQWGAGDALTGAGYQKLRLSTQTVAAVFNFATNLYLIPRYGWYGAAWSSLATDGMLAGLNWVVLLTICKRVQIPDGSK